MKPTDVEGPDGVAVRRDRSARSPNLALLDLLPPSPPLHRLVPLPYVSLPPPEMPRRNSTYEASVASDDLSDYDVISSGGLRSLESSVDDLALGTRTTDGVSEPPPAQAAKEKFATATLSAEDVQTYVKKTLERTVVSGRSEVWERRTVRVYVDGAFDIFHAG